MLEKSLTINKSFGYMTLERMGSRYPSHEFFQKYASKNEAGKMGC